MFLVQYKERNLYYDPILVYEFRFLGENDSLFKTINNELKNVARYYDEGCNLIVGDVWS